jgi:hypothetical protein
VAVHALADRTDELGERFDALSHQGGGVAPGAQDLQVGTGDPGRERRSRGRHQLAGQVADADLAGGDLLGRPLGHPHLVVQLGGQPAGQLDRAQRLAVQDGDAGQGGGVDAVGLVVAANVAAQVGCLLGAHPVDHITGGGEEHRYRQPRRAGRFDHHLHSDPRLGAGQGCCSQRLQAGPDRAHPPAAKLGAGLVQDHRGVIGGHAQVKPHDPSLHASSFRLRLVGGVGEAAFRHGPRVGRARRAALMCVNRHRAGWLAPIPSFGASVAGPEQAFTATRRHVHDATRRASHLASSRHHREPYPTPVPLSGARPEVLT